MKTPTELDLKDSGIGKLVNKVSKMKSQLSDEIKVKTITLAKEIVDLWKNACKQEKS